MSRQPPVILREFQEAANVPHCGRCGQEWAEDGKQYREPEHQPEYAPHRFVARCRCWTLEPEAGAFTREDVELLREIAALSTLEGDAVAVYDIYMTRDVMRRCGGLADIIEARL